MRGLPIAVACLLAGARGFSAPAAARAAGGVMAARPLRAACLMGEPGKESNFSPSTVLSRLPLQSAILGLITLSSAFALTNEVPALGGDRADPIGTAIDAGLALYGSVTLARQAGVLSAGEPPDPATAQAS